MSLKREVGMKVEVYSGDGKEHIGYGTFMGVADVYIHVSETTQVITLKPLNEVELSQAAIDALGNNYKTELLKENPVIKMDDGRVVFGCQVWWRRVDDRPKPSGKIAIPRGAHVRGYN